MVANVVAIGSMLVAITVTVTVAVIVVVVWMAVRLPAVDVHSHLSPPLFCQVVRVSATATHGPRPRY
jgi:hypothetical protein